MQSECNAPQFVLASKSPRRRYLLQQAGLTFTVIPSRVDEAALNELPPEERVRRLAEAKAATVADAYPRSWVIGADTLVLIGETVLGKPSTPAEACRMLTHLSGQTHQVLTGYCICCRAEEIFFSDTAVTEVRFKTLTAEEIEWYIHTREPFDTAGAYAIQGLGTFLVKSIRGSYTNVVGLPVCEVVEFLIRHGALKRDGHAEAAVRQAAGCKS